MIIYNHIEGSTRHGILCEGFSCDPVISGNLIENNRKTGIKLAYCAKAHIGDKGKSTRELSAVLDHYNIESDGDEQNAEIYSHALETYQMFFDEDDDNEMMGQNSVYDNKSSVGLGTNHGRQTEDLAKLQLQNFSYIQ